MIEIVDDLTNPALVRLIPPLVPIVKWVFGQQYGQPTTEGLDM